MTPITVDGDIYVFGGSGDMNSFQKKTEIWRVSSIVSNNLYYINYIVYKLYIVARCNLHFSRRDWILSNETSLHLNHLKYTILDRPLKPGSNPLSSSIKNDHHNLWYWRIKWRSQKNSVLFFVKNFRKKIFVTITEEFESPAPSADEFFSPWSLEDFFRSLQRKIFFANQLDSVDSQDFATKSQIRGRLYIFDTYFKIQVSLVIKRLVLVMEDFISKIKIKNEFKLLLKLSRWLLFRMKCPFWYFNNNFCQIQGSM